jgi:protein SCO1/2
MCPLLTAAMAKLQSELEGDPVWSDMRLVSFSVDPGHDSPAVLADYAAEYAADSAHWKFLTGERDRIWALSVDGFKLAVGENPGGADTPLFHSDQFVLVDASGGIRGYYAGLEDGDRDALVRDLRTLHAVGDPLAATEARYP